MLVSVIEERAKDWISLLSFLLLLAGTWLSLLSCDAPLHRYTSVWWKIDESVDCCWIALILDVLC